MKRWTWMLGMMVVVGVAAANAQSPAGAPGKRPKGPPPPPRVLKGDAGESQDRTGKNLLPADEGSSKDAAIQWFATLTRGLAEAKRTGKPILFVSAAPHCAEDESEKAFVSTLVRGQVANTAFSILSPDGKPVARGRGPGRGPMDLFKDSADMAQGLDAIAEKYPSRPIDGVPALPVTLTPQVGLVLAAGDLQPLVVVLAEDPQRQTEMEAIVAPLAWDKDFEGRFVYATASSRKDLPKVEGHTIPEGVLFFEPDIFRAGGKVVHEIPGNQLAQMLAEAMRATLRDHVRMAKTRRELAALGLKAGIFYETNIPVNGKGEAADRERYKQQLQLRKKD